MTYLPHNIAIQPPASGQFDAIAKLHREGITNGFLSTLGIRFLKELYRGICGSKYGGILVALHQDEVVGYIAYTSTIAGLYREVVFKKGILFIILLVPNLFRVTVVKCLFETLAYPLTRVSREKGVTRRKREDRPELLSMAVHGSFRGSGIGKRLIAGLDDYYRENAIHEYYVATASDDANSNSFYISCGFEKKSIFVHHGNTMIEYVRTLG